MTNQNNELDKILDKYIGFDDMSPTHMQNAKREINNLLDSMDMNGYKRGFKEAQALYAPLKKQQNVNTSTEHVKPVNMSLRQAIQDLEFYTKDGEAIDFIHPEHLDKIMELFNKYTESVDLTKPEVNLIDVASPNMTPEADKVVSDALERSAEVMNKVAPKPVTLKDIASPNMTPEASKVVSEAIERSAEVMNNKPVESELNELGQEVKQVTRELEALVYKAGVAGYNLERSFTDNCKEISGKGSTAQEARKRWGLDGR